MNSEKTLYIIESGKALKLVKQHIAHRVRIRKEGVDLLKELGRLDASVWTHRSTGVISCISARRGQQPEGFTVPDSQGRTWPKKGTDWAKRFADQQGYPTPATEIAKAFDVPLSLDYQSKDGGKGWRRIGFPLSECGYLFMGNTGPYALWIPDVEKIIADCEANGKTITGDAKKFDMTIKGCRRIEQEEWEIMVLQHQLEQKRTKMKGGAA